MKTRYVHTSLADERGVAMIMAMIVLLILTVIGVAANKTAIYDTMTAGIEKKKRGAFYAAEAGLEHGKSIIRPFLMLPLNSDTNDKNPTWKPSLFTGATTVEGETSWATLVPDTKIGTDYTYRVRVKNNRDGGVTPSDDKDGRILIQSESASTTPGGGSAAVEILIGGEFGVTGAAWDKTGQALHGSSKSNTNDDKTAIADGDLSGSPRINRSQGVGLP